MEQHIFILSDLHIAASGPLNNFHAGEELVSFVRALPQKATLLFAGDLFDLLQSEDRPAVFDLNGAPDLLSDLLATVASYEWGAAFFSALGDFVRQGGTCVILPGNHDPELYHPDCLPLLRQTIGLSKDDPGLTLFVEPGPWIAEVGRWEILVGHGHRPDPWNDVDPTRVLTALERAEPSLPLPPGSLLVVKTLNRFKAAVDLATGAPRFPFIDLLKPETPWVPLLLLYLAPRLALESLPGAVGGTARPVLLRAIRRRLLGGPTLVNMASPGEEPEDFFAPLAEAFVEGLTPADAGAPDAVIRRLDLWLSEASLGSPGQLAVHGGAGRLLLRAALRRLTSESTFFDPRTPSAYDRTFCRDHLSEGIRSRVVITGHTHAARFLQAPEGRIYFNTGTWTDLIQPPSSLDDGELQTWIDNLEAGQAPRLRRLTFAEISANGPRLALWDKSEAIPLFEPT